MFPKDLSAVSGSLYNAETRVLPLGRSIIDMYYYQALCFLGPPNLGWIYVSQLEAAQIVAFGTSVYAIGVLHAGEIKLSEEES